MDRKAEEFRKTLGIDQKKADYSSTIYPEGNLNTSANLGAASEFSSVSKTMAPGNIGVSKLGASVESKDYGSIGAGRDTSNEIPARGNTRSPNANQKSPYMSNVAGGQSAERARKNEQDRYDNRYEDVQHRIGKSSVIISAHASASLRQSLASSFWRTLIAGSGRNLKKC